MQRTTDANDVTIVSSQSAGVLAGVDFNFSSVHDDVNAELLSMQMRRHDANRLLCRYSKAVVFWTLFLVIDKRLATAACASETVKTESVKRIQKSNKKTVKQYYNSTSSLRYSFTSLACFQASLQVLQNDGHCRFQSSVAVCKTRQQIENVCVRKCRFAITGTCTAIHRFCKKEIQFHSMYMYF